MASTVGDVANANNATRSICLMAAQAANSTTPSTVADGVPNYPSNSNFAKDTGACFSGKPSTTSTLVIANTSGSGSLTGVYTLYGWLQAFNGGAGAWFPIKVNGGVAVAGTNSVAYQERFSNLGHFDRIALAVASIGGTSPVMEAWLVTAQEAF